MSYKRFVGRTETYQKQDNTLVSRAQTLSRQPEEILFYEFEPATVVDVILDENHKIFKNKQAIVDPEEWPITSTGAPHGKDDLDYSWIGRVQVRQIITEEGISKDLLNWALPLETNIKEYPLINEMVIVVQYLDTLYYSRKLNAKNFINHNADFRWEKRYGLADPHLTKTVSVTKANATNSDHRGSLGQYFKSNDKIRPLQHFEGDTVIESRNGSSIRFGCFVNNGSLDKGGCTIDYSNGRGNPMILIRNRQCLISRDKKSPESLFNGNILEDVNSDGSSIQITSGLTISKWITTCKKKLFGMEEEPKYSGSTPFMFPTLCGEQIIINTDRIVIASRNNETLHFSKKRYAITTDDEYTVDAEKQIVLTTNTKTVLNSPFIYLGQYDETHEPVLLGQTSIEWMYELAQVVRELSEIIGGKNLIQDGKLQFLQLKLPELLSKRVFVTGGGYSPGAGKSEPIPGEFHGLVPRISGGNGDGVAVIDTPKGTFVGLGKKGGIGRSLIPGL